MNAEQAIIEIERVLNVPEMNFFVRFAAITAIIDQTVFTEPERRAEFDAVRSNRTAR